MSRLKKFTLRLDPNDVEVLKRAFPETGYNKAVRGAVHALANKIEENHSRNGATDQ